MEKTPTQLTTKQLREIEDIVIALDEAIDKKEIDHSDLEKLERRFEKASKSLEDNIGPRDSRRYIRDEAESLLLWIKGDKKASTEKIIDAVNKKGDKHLASQAGRGIELSVKKIDTKAVDQSAGKINGWLGFFQIPILILTIFLLPVSIVGLISLFFPPIEFGAIITYFICWTITALSISYLALAPQRSNRARTLATMLYASLTVICIVLLILTFTNSGSSSIEELNILARIVLLFFIVCGAATTAYYHFSEKSRQVFNQ